MTVCTVCKAELPPRDPYAFLCVRCSPLCPSTRLAAYQAAGSALSKYQAQRKRQGHNPNDPTRQRRRLVDALAQSFAAAREATLEAATRRTP